MVKVRIRTGRGTGTIEVDVDDIKFSGDEFREYQKKRKEQVGNRTVSAGRGTSRRKLSDIPDPSPRPSTEGRTRVTGRGTGSRKSRNKGSKN